MNFAENFRSPRGPGAAETRNINAFGEKARTRGAVEARSRNIFGASGSFFTCARAADVSRHTYTHTGTHTRCAFVATSRYLGLSSMGARAPNSPGEPTAIILPVDRVLLHFVFGGGGGDDVT